MLTWANDSNHLEGLVKRESMSQDMINEQIAIMGLCVLRTLLKNIKSCAQSWYSIIADEVTDVCNREQFYLSILWVSDLIILYLRIQLAFSVFLIQQQTH